MRKYYNTMPVMLFAATITISTTTSFAQQDRNQSWQFKGQNRASIAALIRDVEKNGSNNQTLATTPAESYTNLVCGKDGQSSASGNTTCIILNNSDGKIDVGQDSTGDQTASTQSETQKTSVDEVLDALTSQN